MSYKLVGIRYPNYYDVSNKRDVAPVIVETDDSTKLSGMINELLFNEREQDQVNYVLTRWGGKMYICERVDVKNKRYDKVQIDYHPHQSLT